MKRDDLPRRRLLGVANRFPMLVLLSLPLVTGSYSAAASTSDYDVTIDTSSLKEQGATLAFDFIAGGSFANSITILGFSTDGTLGAHGPNSGSVTGALPGSVTLTDASFFNEFLQAATLGTTVSFQLDATTKGPTGGAPPDTFSFFVLDPTATTSLLTTSDPTDANSLFSLQIDGSRSGIVSIYDSQPAVPAALVPINSSVAEPGSLGLLVFGLLGTAGHLTRSRKSARQVPMT